MYPEEIIVYGMDRAKIPKEVQEEISDLVNKANEILNQVALLASEHDIEIKIRPDGSQDALHYSRFEGWFASY